MTFYNKNNFKDNSEIKVNFQSFPRPKPAQLHFWEDCRVIQANGGVLTKEKSDELRKKYNYFYIIND